MKRRLPISPFQRSRVALLVAAAFALCPTVGCDRSDTPAAPDRAALRQAAQTLRETVNARIPPALSGLRFESRVLGQAQVIAAVPQGWVTGVAPGSFRPADDRALGTMTEYTTGSDCHGPCRPKDWAAEIERFELWRYRSRQWTIRRDEPLDDPPGTLLIADRVGANERTALTVVRWRPDAARYYYCRVVLDRPALPLLPAFEAACLHNVPLFLVAPE